MHFPTPSSSPEPLPRSRAGFSLVEVLVAVLVLSIGLLGIAGLQISSMRNNQVSYLRTQAVVLADSMLDRIRANPTGNYALAVADSPADPGGGGNMDDADLYEWTQTLADLLPNGDGEIVRNGDVVTVRVFWTRALRTGDAGNDNQQSVELITEI